MSHSYWGYGGAHDITATLTDDNGVTLSSNVVSVTVLTAPPTISIAPDPMGVTCQINEPLYTYYLDVSLGTSGNPTDAYMIDWGDGSEDWGWGYGSNVASHVYTPGNYTITAATHGTNGAWNDSNALAVSLLPTVALNDNSPTPGEPVFVLGLAASDPCNNFAHWQVDWGDNSQPDAGYSDGYGGGQPPSTLTHFYAEGNRDYTICATVADPWWTCATSTLTAHVSKVLYWDSDGIPTNNAIATGAGLGGASHPWDLTGAYWYDPTTHQDVPWDNSGNCTAVFTGTAPTTTVSLSSPVNVHAITFLKSGYTLQGQTRMALSAA